MLVRHSAIEQVGLMDEDYFLYCEETDWCYRFNKKGWKIMFWPGAKIIHVNSGGQSSKRQQLKMFIQLQKSFLIFLRKHRGRLSYFVARVMFSISFGLRFCVYQSVILFKQSRGRNIVYELDKKNKNLGAFKYCAFGINPVINVN